MKGIALSLVGVLLCVGCGGGSLGPSQPTNPPVTVTAAMTSQGASTINADGKSTIAFTATATVTNSSSSPSWQWTVNGIANGNSTVGSVSFTASGNPSTAVYTAPSAIPSPNPVTVQATASVGGVSGSASGTVTVNTVAVAPTIAIGPSPAIVVLGGSQVFNLTITGSPAPTTTCASLLFGNVPVSGSTATYTVPTAVQTAWTDTLNCTATNSAGQKQASASITIQYPVPTITSVNPGAGETIFGLSNPTIAGNVPINGSGFYAGGTETLSFPGSSQPQITATLPSGTSFGQVLTGLTLGNNSFDPGWYVYTVTSPSGHGGGTSNARTLAFLGNQDTLVFSATDAFQLDQTGTIWKFKLSDSSADGSFAVGGAGEGIAYDSVNNTAVMGTFSSVLAEPSTFGVTSATVEGIAAQSGVTCFAEFAANEIGCFPISTTTNPTATHISITAPWDVAMTSLGGTLSAVTLSVSPFTLTTTGLTTTSGLTLTQTGTFPIANLTPEGQWPGLQGGALMQVFSSGPNQGDIAVLSQLDKVLVRIHMTVNTNGTITMAEVNRVTLSGIPFRIGKNEVDGSIVVALADPVDMLTKFVKVAANGTVTNLSSTVSFLSTGFQVSPDGTKLYCANRGTFQEVPNN